MEGLEYPPSVFQAVENFHPKLKASLDIPDSINVPVRITPGDITIVVPVKDNQRGIDRFLRGVVDTFKPEHYPKEIVIVDNNSAESVQIRNRFPFSVKVISCKTAGPAAARNTGVRAAAGKWLLFTDSDCIPTDSLLAGYLNAPSGYVAYAGLVELEGHDIYTRFYRDQNTFVPLALIGWAGLEPMTLVTANCLVLKSAAETIGLFNERFELAGGEDTDFGIRLRMVGALRYQFTSVSQHCNQDSVSKFANRFMRYGSGNKVLDELYYGSMFRLKGVRVNNQSEITRKLAALQFKAFNWGYEGKPFAEFPLDEFADLERVS